MKHFLIVTVAVLTAILSCNAQAQTPNKKDNKNELRIELAQKQANYIADRLALDSDKRELLVKTYCDCQKETWALKAKPEKGFKKAKTNEEAAKLAKERFERSRKMLDIREKYYKQYSKFLTPLQIEEVYNLEKKAVDHISKMEKQKAKSLRAKNKGAKKQQRLK